MIDDNATQEENDSEIQKDRIKDRERNGGDAMSGKEGESDMHKQNQMKPERSI